MVWVCWEGIIGIPPRSCFQENPTCFVSVSQNPLRYSHICGNIISEVEPMKFVGVREFKQDVVKYLNEGNEIVVMKRKKPIARLTPVQRNSAEIILLEIGRILSEAGVSKREALKALERARREIYG
jgi:antitoxin (DNA-binding transcriptional repressor) of toxin-antitoxin stability system